MADLVRRGAEVTLSELEARDRADAVALETFVDRLSDGPRPDLKEIGRIRHSIRRP